MTLMMVKAQLLGVQLLGCICLTSCLFAQDSKSITTPSSFAIKHGSVSAKPVPLDHLYFHFFVYQVHLDQVAAEHEKQGKDGRWLRDHFEKELGFSDGELGTIRATAVYVTEQVKILNDRAVGIISSDVFAPRDINGQRKLTLSGVDRLKLLNQDREDLLKTQIANLNRHLGPTASQTLEHYLLTRVATQTSVVKGQTPPPASGKTSSDK